MTGLFSFIYMNSDELKRNVGLRVKALRNKYNDSQETLASEFNVNKEKISRIERGLRLLTDDILVGLCNKYNVKPSYFYIFSHNNLEKSELIETISDKLNDKSIRTLKKIDVIVEVM